MKKPLIEIMDKLKDFIRLQTGEKIHPREIEEFYSSIAPIKEICVFTVLGMKEAKQPNVLWAVIRPDLENFRKFASINLHSAIKERFDNASQALPVHKRLEGFTITLSELPLNVIGKIDRYAVKKIYEPRVVAGIEGALPVSGKPTAEEQLLIKSGNGQKILSCLKEISRIKRPIILEDSLELDLGIDSLGRIELTSCLEAAFKAEIQVEAISRAFIVKDLILGVTDALKNAKNLRATEEQALPSAPDYWKKHLRVMPTDEHLEALEFSNSFFGWLLRFILIAFDCTVCKLFFNIKAEGSENVPEEGPYILYPNHTSDLDGPAILACLPRRHMFQLFYFIFIPYFFVPIANNRLLRRMVKAVRLIPFDFSTHFLASLRSAYLVLQMRKGLCFFPEGMRNTTGQIGEFRKGFGILAKESGAKLVPVAIEGAFEAWPATASHPKCHPIRVKFGQALLVEDLEKQGLAMGAKNSYEAINLAARKALVDLKACLPAGKEKP